MGRILRIVFLLFQLISSFDILAQAVVVSSYSPDKTLQNYFRER